MPSTSHCLLCHEVVDLQKEESLEYQNISRSPGRFRETKMGKQERSKNEESEIGRT
jgi:hypothetical protein